MLLLLLGEVEVSARVNCTACVYCCCVTSCMPRDGVVVLDCVRELVGDLLPVWVPVAEAVAVAEALADTQLEALPCGLPVPAPPPSPEAVGRAGEGLGAVPVALGHQGEGVKG